MCLEFRPTAAQVVEHVVPNDGRVGVSNPAPSESVMVSLGKTLDPELLAMGSWPPIGAWMIV